MKHVKSFEAHSEMALDIKNEYTKLKNSPKVKSIDLGKVGEVADSNITNIKQTYKDAIVKVVDGHYVLTIKNDE